MESLVPLQGELTDAAAAATRAADKMLKGEINVNEAELEELANVLKHYGCHDASARLRTEVYRLRAIELVSHSGAYK
jgi:hypothetical protein